MINTGDINYIADIDDVDFDGQTRIFNSIIDRGVDEFNDLIFANGFEQ